MMIGNRGVKVLKRHDNRGLGIRVQMNRKTTIAGKIIYAVVVDHFKDGERYHYDIKCYDGIMDAWEQYKELTGHVTKPQTVIQMVRRVA